METLEQQRAHDLQSQYHQRAQPVTPPEELDVGEAPLIIDLPASADPEVIAQHAEAESDAEYAVREEAESLSNLLASFRASKPRPVIAPPAQLTASPGDVQSFIDLDAHRSRTVDLQRVMSQIPGLLPPPEVAQAEGHLERRLLWGRALRKVSAGWQVVKSGLDDLRMLTEESPEEEFGNLLNCMVRGQDLVDPHGAQPRINVQPPALLDVVDPYAQQPAGPIGPGYGQTTQPIPLTAAGQRERAEYLATGRLEQYATQPMFRQRVAPTATMTAAQAAGMATAGQQFSAPTAVIPAAPKPMASYSDGRRVGFWCSGCGPDTEIFASDETCRKHITIVHLGQAPAWFCQFCPGTATKTYTTWTNIQRHVKNQHRLTIKRLGNSGTDYAVVPAASSAVKPRRSKRKAASSSEERSKSGSPKAKATKRSKKASTSHRIYSLFITTLN